MWYKSTGKTLFISFFCLSAILFIDALIVGIDTYVAKFESTFKITGSVICFLFLLSSFYFALIAKNIKGILESIETNQLPETPSTLVLQNRLGKHFVYIFTGTILLLSIFLSLTYAMVDRIFSQGVHLLG